MRGSNLYLTAALSGLFAAESPPRAGRNFLELHKRWICWGFAHLKCCNRAERLANRADQDVENPWNLMVFRVECTSGEPATSGVTGRIFHNKNNDQPYFDSSKAPQKRPKVFPLPDKKKQPHLMFVMPGYCGDSAAAASAAAFRH
jgi:hypothetical protein